MDDILNKDLSGSSADHVSTTDDTTRQQIQLFPNLQTINGVRISGFYNSDDFKSALRYEARSDDIFIVTYPRSGTTWMQTIVYTLLSGGQPFDSDWFDFETRTPFLEVVGAEGVEQMRRPGTIKTHIPFHCISYNPEAKYICVLRNPKDVCISFYRLYISELETNPNIPSFNDFVNQFMKGNVDFGDYFHHLQSIWSQKNKQNVIIFLYEELISDFRDVIHRLSNFLHIPLDSQLLECIVRYCSITYMKDNYDKKRHDFYVDSRQINHTSQAILLEKQSSFVAPINVTDGTVYQKIRNGIIGEGSTCLTQEQIRHMETKLRQTMNGTGFLEYLSQTHVKGWLLTE